jgi:RNA polymerase sigma factor (sigma-70 family)
MNTFIGVSCPSFFRSADIRHRLLRIFKSQNLKIRRSRKTMIKKFKTNNAKRTIYIYYTEDGSKTMLMPGIGGVTEAIIDSLHSFDDEEVDNNRRETEKHSSIDDLIEQGQEFASDTDVGDISEKNEETTSLYSAMEDLLPQQKELLQKVFFEGKSNVQVATELGITRQALNSRLNKIYEKMKAFLK